MKIQDLYEFTPDQNALLKINQVVPHMDAGGIMIDTHNVAKFTGLPANVISPVLSDYTRRIQPKHMVDGHHSEEVNAVIAVAYMLKNNRLNQTQISKQQLEDATNLPYDDIVKIVHDNLPEIQKAVQAFRPSWVVPIEKKPWGSFSEAEQKQMLVMYMTKLLKMGAENVTAKDTASAILHSGRVSAKDADSIRRDIDRFLSSNDPEMMKLDKHRPQGRQVRSVPDDHTMRTNRSWVRAS